jgi:hypothetical protein
VTVTQTTEELSKHLSEQIRFLRTSAAAFDAGEDGEAKRIATAVRVLCHDTRSSTSLLTQLNLKGILFHNTASEFDPDNLTTTTALLELRLNTDGTSGHQAPLDNRPPHFIRKTSFDDWWGSVILDDAKGSRLRRKDLVLYLANKDGGAHVDPHIPAEYAAIIRNEGFGWWLTDNRGTRPFPGRVERLSMRQIAHEVLVTLERHGLPPHQ